MPQFIKNDDGSVSDLTTGLTWLHVTGKRNNHKSAEALVNDLGNGYRLPTDHELLSVVDRSRHSPAIDTDFFPDVKSDWYWTSTPCAWNEAAVWVVNFSGGGVSGYRRNGNACVLAVRSSQ